MENQNQGKKTKKQPKVKTLKLQDGELHDNLKKISTEAGLPLEVCVEQAIKEFVNKYKKDYEELSKLKVEYYKKRMEEGSELAKLALRKLDQGDVVKDFVFEKIIDNGKKAYEKGMKDLVENNKKMIEMITEKEYKLKLDGGKENKEGI